MPRLVLIPILVLAGPCLSSCYYLIHGSTQKVELQSNPSGAIVQVNDGQMGVTPCTLNVKREDALTFNFHKAGYKPVFVTDTPSERSPILPLSSPAGGGAGVGTGAFFVTAGLLAATAVEDFVDARTGSLSSHTDEIDVQLEPLRTVAASSGAASISP